MTTPLFNCLSFDGKDDYLDCSALNFVDFANEELTIEVWVFTTEKDAHMCLLSTAVSASPVIGLFLNNEHTTDGVLIKDPVVFYYKESFITEELSIHDGKWHHCAFVFGKNSDGVTRFKYIYTDGIPVSDSIPIQSLSFEKGFQDLNIGRSSKNNGSLYFKGKIAEVRIWKKARTEAEIKATKDQQLLGTEPDLFAYWSFDPADAQQAIVKDKAGKSDLKIMGATWESDHSLVWSPSNISQPTPPEQAQNPPTAPIQEPDGIDSLLTTLIEDDWRKQVVQEAKNATTNGVLAMNDVTFTGFNLLKTVTDTLFKVININDVKVELANSAGVEKVSDAASDTGKPATVGSGKTPRPKPLGKRFRIKTGGGVSISGSTDLLGLKSADVALEFTMSDNKEKDALIKIKAGSSEGNEISKLLGEHLPKEITDILSVLDKAQLLNPAFAFSTSSVFDTEEPFDVGISEGFNFFGNLDLSEFKSAPNTTQSNVEQKHGLEDMLGFVADFFQVNEITARLCIRKQQTGGLALELDTILETDLEFSANKNFKMVFQGAVISLAFGGSPPEPKVSISSSVLLTLHLLGADELALSVNISVEPESISFAFTLQQMEGVWHPFGFEQVSVKAMAAVIGATYLKPWIDNFGFATEDLTIGSVKGSMALMLDTNDYDKFVFQIKTQKIKFLELASTFSALAFTAYQILPSTLKTPLEEIINCQVEDMELSFVPVAATIGDLVFDKEGITIKGALYLWGWKAIMEARFSANEIDLAAEMDTINITLCEIKLLKIEGYESRKKPFFKLYLGTDKDPNFAMSIAVTLLDISIKVEAKADKDGLLFKFENQFVFGSISLESSVDSSKFYGKGSFDLNLNESIDLKILGTIHLNSAVHLATIIRMDAAFYLSLTGGILFVGHTANISFEIHEPFANLEDLPEKLIQYLKANAEKIFAAVFKTLEEWADAVKDGAITFSGNVAGVAKDAFHLGEDAVAQIIDVSKELGETPEQIAKSLETAYNLTADGIASAFKAAGYTIDAVRDALDYGLDTTESNIKSALQSADYAIDAVEDALKPLNPINWLPAPVVESILSWSPFD